MGCDGKFITASVLFLFSMFFFLDYLALALHLIPRSLTWIPEVISLVILIYILGRFFKEKDLISILTQTHLVVLFIGFTFLGLLINRIELPVAVAGIRNNLKFLPLFFLPFFYQFEKEFIKRFFTVLFFFALLQFPVTVIQRIIYETPSGDPIGGTLGANSSGILSVFLSISIVFWSFYFLKTELKPAAYIAGFAALLIPMGLNETKIIFFILPPAFAAMFLFTQKKRKLSSKMLIVFLCFSIGLLFIGSVYNRMYVEKDIPVKQEIKKKAEQQAEKEKQEVPQKVEPVPKKEQKSSESPGSAQRKPSRLNITEYFIPKRAAAVLHKKRIRVSGSLNRIPQVIFAFDHIKQDPLHLLLGVGAGNASDSFFEPAKGKYHKKFEDLDIGNNMLSRMLWEYGLIGTFLFFSIFVYLFGKIWRLRKRDDTMGVAASGYLVMIGIYFITSIYFNTMLINLFAYLFWFLGGYLLAYRYFLDKRIKLGNETR